MFASISRLSKREKYIAYISFALIVCIIFDRAVIRPVMMKLENLNNETQEQQKKLEKSIYILQQEDSINSEYKKYAQHLKQKISDEEVTAEMLSSIEKIAKSTSVAI